MTFVDDCRREWKRLRVPDAVANEMAAELTADLEEAALEGASPEDVLGYAVFDARAFAAQWAEERGVVGPEPAPRRRLVPLAFVIALGLFLVITVAGVALLVDGGHFASARVAVGTNFPAPRIRKLLVPPPSRPFARGERPRVFILPGARRVQLTALPPPPATAGLVFLGVGLGGIVVTLATWLVLGARRRVIV